MTSLLLLIAVALIFRAEGAVLRRETAPFLWRLVGWLFVLAGVWVALLAANAWPPLWPLPLLALLGAWLHHRQPQAPVSIFIIVGVELLFIGVIGRFSLPPLPWPSLLGTAVLVIIVGLLIDIVAGWLSRRWSWGMLAVLALVPLLLAVVVPPVRATGARLVNTRLLYLLPAQVATADPTPIPRPTSTPVDTMTATAVSATATATTPPVIVETPALETAVAATQWFPYTEWRLPNPTYDGNPYDLIATATFVHDTTGEIHKTGMFYAGDDIWAFRFTGTRPGRWTYRTSSPDAELDGHEGAVEVATNPDSPGFVSGSGDKWIRTGSGRAFIPQFVMIGGPQTYYENPGEIAYNIDAFLNRHGFNGVHTPVFCRWFDLEQQRCSRINVADPNPDPRTFVALESLITDVYAAGGVVHIWMWGDDSRSENPKRWGINGTADLRLQRYIAARLGPLPGWTMGYGYDLFEWVDGEQLTAWHDMMHAELGWPHYLGARANKNQLNQLSEALDYSSYEQHRPDYDMYVQTITQRPDKPSFSEDRFRIRDEGRAKDYTMDLTRRGLWHSAMAGGVANIWGNLIGAPQANDSLTTSAPYPDPAVIQTYARFFADRFWVDMERCNDLTDGVCLERPSNAHYLFYAEDAESVTMDLSGMAGAQTAVAVDTRLPYAEIEIGELAAESHTWAAPYVSDWAIAVGSFSP